MYSLAGVHPLALSDASKHRHGRASLHRRICGTQLFSANTGNTKGKCYRILQLSVQTQKLYTLFPHKAGLNGHLCSKTVTGKPGGSTEIIIGGVWERRTYWVSNRMCPLKMEQCPALLKCNVNTYKKGSVRGKHRCSPEIDSWREGKEKKPEKGGETSWKWALHFIANQRRIRNCWPFHNHIDLATGQKSHKANKVPLG